MISTDGDKWGDATRQSTLRVIAHYDMLGSVWWSVLLASTRTHLPPYQPHDDNYDGAEQAAGTRADDSILHHDALVLPDCL